MSSIDELAWCEECKSFVEGEYCSEHGPDFLMHDNEIGCRHAIPPCVPNAILSTPAPFLYVAPSSIPGAGLGVFAAMTLPYGVRFGPYRGRLVSVRGDSRYGWEIRDSRDRVAGIVSATNPQTSNWMRYVNCSRHSSENNLVAFQERKQIYYRTSKIILAYTELLVYYGDSYAKRLNIDVAAYNAPSSEHCQHCCKKK